MHKRRKSILLSALALLLLTGCASRREPPAPENAAENGSSLSSERENAVRVTATLVIELEGWTLYAAFEENPAAAAFAEQLNDGPLELEMQDCGGFEKVGVLPWTPERSDERIDAQPGDLILDQENRLAICYGQNSGDLTRLGRIASLSGQELRELLGEGGLSVRFWLEWSE